MRFERGNAAAMREALVAMVKAETEGSMDRDDLCGRCFEKMWDKCKHDGSCWVDKVINALSAPARNCDRFNTGNTMKDAEDAYCEWQRHCDNPTIPPSCKVESAFKQWLFAPAAERKGECDGR